MSRKEDLEKYYENPSYCNNCKKIIKVKEKEFISNVRIRKFCSQPCAASFNNRKFPKRKPEGECDSCSAPVPCSRKYCSQSCKVTAIKARKRTDAKERGIKAVVEWRQKVKIKALVYKGQKCLLCGYCKCTRSLHFHHLDPSLKEFSITATTVSWARILLELDKCVLICGNCHGEVHEGLISTEELIELENARKMN